MVLHTKMMIDGLNSHRWQMSVSDDPLREFLFANNCAGSFLIPMSESWESLRSAIQPVLVGDPVISAVTSHILDLKKFVFMTNRMMPILSDHATEAVDPLCSVLESSGRSDLMPKILKSKILEFALCHGKMTLLQKATQCSAKGDDPPDIKFSTG